MFYELLKDIKTLSVIGMCKNAGKTTVLNTLISECEAAGEILGLTSIGRDGERSDLVTNTHKPEIFVGRGAVIATAEGLLKEGDVSREILDATGIPTPMGEIVIVRAASSGFVQLGGASITEQQKLIRDKLIDLGCTRVFIDGAISRKSLGTPALCDGVILSSGASYDPDISLTAEDTAFIAKLFSLPVDRKAAEHMGLARYTAVHEGEAHTADDINALVPVLKAGAELMIMRGAVTDSTAAALTAVGKLLRNTLLVAEDASRLLLKAANYEKLMRFTRGFEVMKGTKLIAVTVNPFSAYGLHYDKKEFGDRVREALERARVTVPVMDVKDA
ncbi:MAG: hypothetical protein K6G56_09440 [Clostridiales bacterium]|nr:hypothetical protein [Clostridiales bacterium]